MEGRRDLPEDEEAEDYNFYRRNAGGPVATTSLTRGRGVVSGIVGDYDWHVGSRCDRALLAKELRLGLVSGGPWPTTTAAD